MNLTFEIIQKYVDDIVLVTEQEISEAVLTLLSEAHLLAEPAGAASTAALLHRYHPKSKEKIALIVSGANISIDFLVELLKRRK